MPEVRLWTCLSYVKPCNDGALDEAAMEAPQLAAGSLAAACFCGSRVWQALLVDCCHLAK